MTAIIIFATLFTVCLAQKVVFSSIFLLPPFGSNQIAIRNLYVPKNSSLSLVGTYQNSFNISDSGTVFYSK